MSLPSYFCFVYGSSAAIFEIKMTAESRLSQLRSQILEQKRDLFAELGEHHLTLWKVPFDQDTGNTADIKLEDGTEGVTKLQQNQRVDIIIPPGQEYMYLIVVQRPPKLFCFVRGFPAEILFELQFWLGQSVYDLKEKIKEKAGPQIDNIPAHQFVLWMVDREKCDSKDFQVKLQEDVPGVRQLLSQETVQTIFPESFPNDRFIIIANVIKVGNPFDIDPSLDRVKARTDIATDRKKNFRDPPSTLGAPDQFEKIQKSDTYYFGCARPPRRELPLPLALFHPVFGDFVDNCKAMIPKANDYKFAKILRDDMCNFHVNEDTRRSKLCNHLTEFGINVTPGPIGSSKESTDGHIMVGKNHPIYIQELKNEIGLGGGEPSFQALLYFQSFVDQYELYKEPSSCHPCFLIYLSGPHLAFAGAILTERANLEVFSLLPLNFHTTNEEAFESLARHLIALKEALISLGKYYDQLDLKAIQPVQTKGPFFPYPSSFRDLRTNKKSSLTYRFKLINRDFLFKGWISEKEESVCIKFVRRYGDDVHQWCAEHNIAPKLFGFEKFPGGWLMVVMESLDTSWESLSVLKLDPAYSQSKNEIENLLLTQLKSCVFNMHLAGMVHGDIRDANIMVNLKSKSLFKLVDFDWGGKTGQVTYPMFVNRQSIKRPDGVEDGKLILVDHDDAMVNGIFG